MLRRLVDSLPLVLAVAFVAAYTTACCCCPLPSTGTVEILRDPGPVEIAPNLVAKASPAQAH